MKYHWLLSFIGLCSSSTVIQEHPQALRLFETLHDSSCLSNQKCNEKYSRTVGHDESPRIRDQASTTPPGAASKFLTEASSKYLVNGSGIPEIDFNIGESYAGLMPISNKENETDNLYFWFFPVATEEFKEKEEIVIWLNGGPGCSSLFGLSQENGPFLWRPGMNKPQKNPWSFNLLTNVVWVEQPVTTGFSKGKATITNEDELAEQFLGFWENFVDTFGMEKYDIYIAAESYGGMYGPYIGKHLIHDAKYRLKGLLIYDGLMFSNDIQTNVVVKSFMEMHRDIWAFDDSTRRRLYRIADQCNFTSYEKQYLQYPPSGPSPIYPPGYSEDPEGQWLTPLGCIYFFDTVFEEMAKLNPCVSMYNVMNKCPPQFDPIQGTNRSWFDREDVKKAINAPLDVKWVTCRGRVFANSTDESSPSGHDALPYVIENTQNVIIAHGSMDFILPMNGVLLGIQNMTWGGKMGFQEAPKDPFFVPSYSSSNDLFTNYAQDLPSGTGILGTTHHERGLTFVVTQQAGHEGPGDSPAGAMRHLEKLTGRVNSLSSHAPFTLPELRNVPQTVFSLAQGTVPIPCFGRGC